MYIANYVLYTVLLYQVAIIGLLANYARKRERVNGRKNNVEWRQIEWEKSVCVNIGKISKDEN